LKTDKDNKTNIQISVGLEALKTKITCMKRSHVVSYSSPVKSSLSNPRETNAEVSQCDSTLSQEQKESVSSIEINDRVLVRYYSRNTWKYYIGVVTASNDDDTFDISFYTTMRTKGELKFKKPSRLDRDAVPRESIIKVIELSKISDKPEMYQLLNQNDATFF
jgi:hypothetical protein